MAEKIEKNDFIELEYTGRIKGGEIFDTNIKEEAEKLNPEAEAKPVIICLGQNMILKAIDDFLIGKETGNYVLELKAENAFGLRNRELVKTMPLSAFKNSNTAPRAGMVFAFDNMLAKISAVSPGRVIVDFNNPLADKDVVYELEVTRKINSIEEKIKSLMNAFFRQEFKFSVQDKTLEIETPEKIAKFVMLFSERFKEILGLELKVGEIKEIKATAEDEKNHHSNT